MVKCLVGFSLLRRSKRFGSARTNEYLLRTIATCENTVYGPIVRRKAWHAVSTPIMILNLVKLR